MSYSPSLKENVDIGEESETLRLYGQPLREPILGKHFQLPGRSGTEQRIDLDITASYIPVFTHLKIHEATDLEKPPTPPAIRRIANESYMEFYSPPQVKNDALKRDSDVDRKTSTKAPIILRVDDKSAMKRLTN